MKAKHSLYLCAAMLSGCATSANFSKALEEPVKTANAAKLVVEQAQRDAEKARVMGWLRDVRSPTTGWAPLVCRPSKTMGVTLHALGAFGEALTLIKEVGEKPADTTYAAYLEQYRKNRDNLADARTLSDQKLAEKEWKDAEDKAEEARVRCIALYQSDAFAANKLDTSAGGEESAGSILALSNLLKALAGLGESVQREAAVRETAAALVPGLKLAYLQLNGSMPQYAPQVVYSRSTDELAKKMAQTRLGGTVNLHRWFVARQIEQSLKRVQACKATEECLGDPLMRMTLDNLIADILAYRSLSAIDTTVILKALDKGVTSAETVVKNPGGNWAQILDALLGAVDAIDGLNTQYKAVQTSRE